MASSVSELSEFRAVGLINTIQQQVYSSTLKKYVP